MDVVEITADLVSYNSASQNSNTPVSEAIARWLHKAGMSVEARRLHGQGRHAQDKRRWEERQGSGRPRPFSPNSDVVPAEGWDSDPFRLRDRQGRLYGRGSADMKGSVACMIGAANAFTEQELKLPVYVIVTADERNRLRRRQGRRAEIQNA